MEGSLRVALSAATKQGMWFSGISAPHLVRFLLVAGLISGSWLLASNTDRLHVLGNISQNGSLGEVLQSGAEPGKQMCPVLDEAALSNFQVVPYLACGRSRLFQDTGLLHLLENCRESTGGVARFEGHQATPIHAELNTPVSVWFQNCGGVRNYTDLDVNAWLEGPTLVPATVLISSTGSIEATFVLLEPGDYSLFVKLLWVNGSQAEPGFSGHVYLGGQRESGQGGPFHNPSPRDMQCHENSFLVGSSFHVTTKPSADTLQLLTNSSAKLSLELSSSGNSTSSSNWTSTPKVDSDWLYQLSDNASSLLRTPMPLCNSYNAIQNALQEGMWVPAHFGDRLCTAKPETCSDSQFRVFDIWNPGWLWTGYDCSFQLYTCEEICSNLRQREVEKILVIGDSLMREQYLNLQHLLESCCQVEIVQVVTAHRSDMVAFIEANAVTYAPQMLIVNFALVHAVWHLTNHQLTDHIEKVRTTLGVSKIARSIPYKVYLTPGYMHGLRKPEITTSRVRLFSNMLEEAIGSIRDSWYSVNVREVTSSRQNSSWDGLHYQLGDKEGGVSVMMTHILLNVLFVG